MAADRGAKGEAMRFPGEQTEVAMNGMKGKMSSRKVKVEKRQFDMPTPKEGYSCV